ncbi:MAG: hypothetical protein J6I61_10705 [Prevotella sp.]|nr:hypothetical protein [Prevotella sp.]MBP3757735.1 hypothetical protein [Prevotella sp.]
MCDGDYDGGYGGDPDYDDLEFRERNPNIYGNDEYMQDYYGSSRKNRYHKRANQTYYDQTSADRQFHEEYLQWKRDHPDRVEYFKSKKHGRMNGRTQQELEWPEIIVRLIILAFFIAVMVFSCCDF